MRVPALDPSFVSKGDKERERKRGHTHTFENAQCRKVEQIQREREREGGGVTHTQEALFNPWLDQHCSVLYTYISVFAHCAPLGLTTNFLALTFITVVEFFHRTFIWHCALASHPL